MLLFVQVLAGCALGALGVVAIYTLWMLMKNIGIALLDLFVDLLNWLANLANAREGKRAAASKPAKKIPKIHFGNLFAKRKKPRTTKAIFRRLTKYAKKNPAVSEYVYKIAQQMLVMLQYQAAFDAIVRESEHGDRGEKSRKVFEATIEEMRQNYSDMLNLFIAAGADVGKATKKTLNTPALKEELDSNQLKLDYLHQLLEQVTVYINQVDGAGVNLGIETEIATLSRLNRLDQEAAKAAKQIKTGKSPFMAETLAYNDELTETDFTNAEQTSGAVASP